MAKELEIGDIIKIEKGHFGSGVVIDIYYGNPQVFFGKKDVKVCDVLFEHGRILKGHEVAAMKKKVTREKEFASRVRRNIAKNVLGDSK